MKRYFIIDQQIVRHFLNSRISANHDEEWGFKKKNLMISRSNTTPIFRQPDIYTSQTVAEYATVIYTFVFIISWKYFISINTWRKMCGILRWIRFSRNKSICFFPFMYYFPLYPSFKNWEFSYLRSLWKNIKYFSLSWTYLR